MPNKLLKSEKTVGYSVEIPYKSFSQNEDDTDDSNQEKETVTTENSPQEWTQIRFEAINNSKYTLKFRLVFKKHANNSNVLCPESPIKVEVLPQNSKDIIIISKLVPTEPWPKLNYGWEPIYVKNDRPNEDQHNSNLQNYSDDVAVNVSDDDIRGASAQISCPRCTSFNDSTATKCDVCEYVLKTKA